MRYASGGAIDSGSALPVGESGPELLIPNACGYVILPHSSATFTFAVPSDVVHEGRYYVEQLIADVNWAPIGKKRRLRRRSLTELAHIFGSWPF